MRWCNVILLTICVTTATGQSQAMPRASIAVPSFNIFVASGCGLGVRRGPLDGCEIIYDGNYGFRRDAYNHYYVGFNRGGLCGPGGMRFVCDYIGRCHGVCR